MTAHQLQKKYKNSKQFQKTYESSCLDLTTKINNLKKSLNNKTLIQDSFVNSRIVECEIELNNLQQILSNLITVQNKIEEFIYSISNDSVQSLLIQYVIKQNTWETAARNCYMSSSRAKHICNDYLKKSARRSTLLIL